MKMIKSLILKISLFVMAFMAFVAFAPTRADARIFLTVSPSSGAVEKFEANKPVAESINDAMIFRDINDFPAVTNSNSRGGTTFNLRLSERVSAARFSECPKMTVKFKRVPKLWIVYRHRQFRFLVA